jgi:hypothetical protein
MSDNLNHLMALLIRQIAASSILKEAARRSGEKQRVLPGLLASAIEDYQKVLSELQKKGL